MPKSLLPDNTCTRGCGGGFDIASTTGVGVEGLPDVAFFYPVLSACWYEYHCCPQSNIIQDLTLV